MDYGEPDAIPASDFDAILTRLQHLFNNLPVELPERALADSDFVSFGNFALDEDILEKTGCEVATLGEQLEAVFGFKARTTGDGIVEIKERGAGGVALVGVLRSFFERNPSNNVLRKWIIDITKGAEKVFLNNGKLIPTSEADSVSGPSNSVKRPRSETLEALTGGPKSSKEAKTERTLHVPPSRGPGRNPNALLHSLVRQYKQEMGHGQTPKSSYDCIGCGKVRSGNLDKARILNHASTCTSLQAKYPDLFKEANNTSNAPSLGEKVEARRDTASAQVNHTSGIGAPVLSKPMLHKSSSHSFFSAPKDTSNPLRKSASQAKLKADVFLGEGTKRKQEQRAARNDEINLAILRLFTVHALPTSLIDSGFWKHLLKVLDPGHTPTDSTTFTTKLVPDEARAIRKKTKKRLQESHDLTLTFDGTSIRKPATLYTTHATTPSRETYFISGHYDDAGKSEHHTAEWVKNKLSLDILDIGVKYWAAMCSDNTSVTKNTRRDINARWPTIENLRDCVHLIQNTLENITKLPEFKEFGTTLKEILKHFKKSTHSTLRLIEEQTGGGGTMKSLKSIGKTRFGTWYLSVQSLLPHLMAIRTLFQKKEIKFKSKRLQELFGPRGSADYIAFEDAMKQYMYIVEPFVRSLWSLEAANANASDVLIFWVAIGGTLKERFEDPELEIPTPLANKVTEIFNTRYEEMFENDLYFVALMLDPRFKHEDILVTEDTIPITVTVRRPQASSDNAPPPRPAEDPADDDVPFSTAFKRVKARLKTILKALCDFAALHPQEGHPLIVSLGEKEVALRLRDQLFAFWRGAGIWHSNKSADTTDPYRWWKNIGTHEDADILALVAKKVFAILTNSMPDERTNSTITWMNSAIRGSQLPQTVIDHLTIRQWYLVHEVPPEVFELMSERQRNMSKLGAKPKYRPVVKFRALPKETLRQAQGLEEDKPKEDRPPEAIVVSDATVPPQASEDELSDEEGMGDSDTEAQVAPAPDPEVVVPLKKIKIHKEIDFESPELLDMLSDTDLVRSRARKDAPRRAAGDGFVGNHWGW